MTTKEIILWLLGYGKTRDDYIDIEFCDSILIEKESRIEPQKKLPSFSERRAQTKTRIHKVLFEND